MKNNDKRWLTKVTYIDVTTGEIIGQKLPQGYTKTKTISKEYKEDEKYRYIESYVGARATGIQQQIEFREFKTG